MLLQLFGAFGKAFPAATQKLQTHTETLLNSAWHTLTLTQTATADSGQRIRSYRSNKDSDCDGQVNWKFELHRTDGRRQSRRRCRCRPAVRVHFVILWMCRVVAAVALVARGVVVVVAWLLLWMLLPLLLLLPLLTGPQLAVSASFTQLSTSLSFSDISSSLLH